MKWMAILCSVVSALATGCKSDNGNGTGGGTFAGTKWHLVAWSVSSLEPARFTITADFSESAISGRSAVNGYGGSYTACDKGTFSVGELQSTLLGGSDDAMRAESLYFELLRQARQYVVSGSTLTLKDAGNQDILIFQSRNNANLAFMGTVKWQTIESGFYAIDADDGNKYEPINLPSEYRVNDLRVRVTAKKRDDMASINMYGAIIEIISISRL